MRVPPDCHRLIEQGALFAISHSGGKDSQAITILLSRLPLPGITGIPVPFDRSPDFPETPDLQPLLSLEAGR